jgi:hypothetical protein
MNIIHICAVRTRKVKEKERERERVKVEGKGTTLKFTLQTKHNQNDRLFTFQRSRVATATTQSN